MSWTYKLNTNTNDMIINAQGKLERVNGSDEVVQRVRVALRHYFAEYFINVTAGIPWYEEILGATGNSSKISNIIRNQILSVPGVTKIVEFSVNYNSITRAYIVTASITVQSGPDEADLDFVIIDGIPVAVEEQ